MTVLASIANLYPYVFTFWMSIFIFPSRKRYDQDTLLIMYINILMDQTILIFCATVGILKLSPNSTSLKGYEYHTQK